MKAKVDVVAGNPTAAAAFLGAFSGIAKSTITNKDSLNTTELKSNMEDLRNLVTSTS